MHARDYMMPEDHVYKIMLVGSCGVGKSTLLVRYKCDEFRHGLQPSIGAEFITREMTLQEGMPVKAQFWDTGGQPRYVEIAFMHFKGAHGALVVYDVTNRSTFDDCQRWVADVRQRADPNVAIVLVGSKLDKVDEDSSARQVTCDEAEKLAEELGLFHIETSSVTPSNVASTFEKIVQEAYYHSKGIFNQYKKIVITLNRVANEVAELGKHDESVTLQATNMAGESMMIWTFNCTSDPLDSVWKTLADCIGKPRQCLQVVQKDGTLLVDDLMLAEFLGCDLQTTS